MFQEFVIYLFFIDYKVKLVSFFSLLLRLYLEERDFF